MSMWGAFTNSVQAMNSQSRALNNISQNVANVSTAGYKRIDSRFATLLSQSMAGTDIFSVKNTDRQLIDRQGLPQQTQRWNDVALSGEGFFVVNSQTNGSGEMLFTRKGSFALQPVAPNSSDAYLVDGQGNYLQGWPVTTRAGESTVGGNLVPVRLDQGATVAGEPSTRLALQANLGANATQPQRLSVNAYDNALNLSALDLTFTPTAVDNQWTVTATPAGGTASAPFTMTFDVDGRPVAPAAATANFTWADGTAGSLNLDLAQVTQLGDSTALLDYTVDGSANGTLVGTYFSRDGELVGSFSNGVDQALYKLPVARFVSPNNLEERAGNVFAATEAAGDFTLDELGIDWQSTVMMGETLEASNVDMAEEFSRMIMTQRAYSSAAQVFKAADEMTSTAGQMNS